MGRVLPIVSSTKQNLNTKIFTETEIMGVDESVPAIFWTQYFFASQDYNVKYNGLHQDNKSSIILEKNGKSYIIKITKHIDIWYLFITDRVNSGEVSVFWCPTGDMLGDYITKPLQGDMFRKFRYQIMGVILNADPGPGKFKVEHLIKA